MQELLDLLLNLIKRLFSVNKGIFQRFALRLERGYVNAL